MLSILIKFTLRTSSDHVPINMNMPLLNLIHHGCQLILLTLQNARNVIDY